MVPGWPCLSTGPSGVEIEGDHLDFSHLLNREAGALTADAGVPDTPIWLMVDTESRRVVDVDITGLDLWHLPNSHRDGPIFLNVLRYMDILDAVAMASERTEVRIHPAR